MVYQLLFLTLRPVSTQLIIDEMNAPMHINIAAAQNGGGDFVRLEFDIHTS